MIIAKQREAYAKKTEHIGSHKIERILKKVGKQV